MKRVCVFCGSGPGLSRDFERDARSLGNELASSGMELVYGGASVGLMGAVADACLAAGGQVTGVLPKALQDLEIAHSSLTRLHIVDSMHDRKKKMADLSDGFVALAGGLGTIEELFEVWTWAQLGLHRKPCAVLNTGGYFDYLLRFLDGMEVQRFVRPVHREMLIVETDPTRLLIAMGRYLPRVAPKRIDAVEIEAGLP